MPPRHRLPFVPTLAGLLAAVLLIAPPAAAGEDERRIAVVGHGEVEAAPDIARFSAGVVSFAASASEALALNNGKARKLLETLAAAGVAPGDTQTRQFALGPRYAERSGHGEPEAIVGYEASTGVAVTVRDLARLGTLLDALVEAGANQIYGIEFALGEPQARLDEARRRAFADARRKAELLAQAAGARLGPVLRIDEPDALPPGPMGLRIESLASGPLAPGEARMSASLAVVFALE